MTDPKPKRVQSEASKVAALVKAYFKAKDKADRDGVAVEKAHARHTESVAKMEDAARACYAKGVNLTQPE